MPLGAIAVLRVLNPQVLDNEVMHRIPHAMMKEMWRIEAQINRKEKSK